MGNPLFDAIGIPPINMGMQMPAPQPAPPARQGMSKGQMIMGIIADALAGAAGQQGGFAQHLARQKQQEQEEVNWGRRRQEGREDKQWEWDNKPRDLGSPYRNQDNAGNVWEQQPDGQFKRVFTDMTPKAIVQDGMLNYVHNPFAQAPGAVPPTTMPPITDDLWNQGQSIGGQTVPPSGGFPATNYGGFGGRR